MFDELDDFASFTVDVVDGYRASIKHWRGAFLIHAALDELIARGRYALTHYFPVPMNASFLQGSSLGPPQVKWAKFTNDDFAAVTTQAKAFAALVFKFYASTVSDAHRAAELPDALDALLGLKDGELWFAELNEHYEAARLYENGTGLVRVVPFVRERLVHGTTTFERFNNHADGPRPSPPIFRREELAIDEAHDIVATLVSAGAASLDGMAASRDRLARLIQAHATLDQLLAPSDQH